MDTCHFVHIHGFILHITQITQRCNVVLKLEQLVVDLSDVILELDVGEFALGLNLVNPRNMLLTRALGTFISSVHILVNESRRAWTLSV